MRVAPALAAVSCAAAVAAGASAATSARFVSKLYGYSLTISGTWSARYAIDAWDGSTLYPNTPASDTFTDPDGRSIVIAAKAVAKRMTLARWATAEAARRPGACSKPRTSRPTTLAGVAARELSERCSDGYDVLVVVALHRGRGYVLALVSPTPQPAAADRRVLTAARRGFRFLR